MKALVWDGDALTLRDRPDPSQSGNDAIVRVHLAGICNTDLEIVRGYMGFRGTPGHEIVGTVIAGPDAWLGARVVAEINFACGTCSMCRRDLGRHCPTRRVMGILDADGGFAEYVAVPLENLHRVPDSIADDQAVFVEPLAAAFEILAQLDVTRGQSCTVLGDGKLGLLAAQVLSSAGVRVRAVGKHPDKLAILARRDIETVLLEDWDREPAEIVVEATGSAAGFATAVASTLPRGTLVLKTTVAEQPGIDLAPIVINEINVLGSRCGLFPPALAALTSNSIDVKSLISETLPLKRSIDAFEVAQQRESLKVVIAVAD